MYEEEDITPEFMKRPKKNPFRTPDHYFDSIEDRVMGTIENENKKKSASGSSRAFQLLKPILGLAASFALVYVLAYYPFKYFTPKEMVKAETTDTIVNDSLHNYAFNISFVDENSLVNAIFGDEAADSTQVNSDELLAYLSSDMNDLEIYTEIQN